MFRSPVTNKHSAQTREILEPTSAGSDRGFGYNAQLSRDGTRILVNNRQGPWRLPRIIDAVSGNEIFKNTSQIDNEIIFSPNGKYWANLDFFYYDGVSYSGRVIVYDDAGSIVRTIPNPRTGQFDVFGSSASFSNDGTRIAISAPIYRDGSNYYGRVFIFETLTGTLVRTILSPLGAQAGGSENQFGYKTRLSADGTIIAISAYYENSKRGKVYIYNVSTGALITSMTPASGSNLFFGSDISFTSDGRFVLISAPAQIDTLGGNVYLYDATNGSLLVTYSAPSGVYNFGEYVAMSADGTRKVIIGKTSTGSYPTRTCRIYDGESTTPFRTFTLKTQDQTVGLSISQDGSRLAIGCTDQYYTYNSYAGLIDFYEL